MSKEIYWVETTEEVFFAIYMKHKKQMCVFGTLTYDLGNKIGYFEFDLFLYQEEKESLADTAARLWLKLKKEGLV